ncbi:MAG: hypothetical protein GF372_12870 [Candidatus Marinimicrobia bacterium]|nr:hypothetical protein [Candidatus Neomarinimicrobiota bacterium]
MLHVCSQVMLDLNRLATDLIFFSMPGIGYFDLPDEFCTGSSIMPQKKNPDVFELVRAKYHTVLGYQQQIQSMVANLISGYHRDYQLTKEPVMQGLNTTLQSLSIMTFVFSGLDVNRENCEAGLTDEVYATQRAYELVKQGVPFREAYKQISEKYR